METQNKVVDKEQPLKPILLGKLRGVTSRMLYKKIMTTEDFSPIVRTMIQENVTEDEVGAMYLIDAFIQWLCTGACNNTKSFLMFHGDIDKTFHSMILNTRWYMRFCSEHIGCYVHHDPLDRLEALAVIERGAIPETVSFLVKSFGKELHPELGIWVSEAENGFLNATSVSCVCNGYDD